jgi:hypothetical protein
VLNEPAATAVSTMSFASTGAGAGVVISAAGAGVGVAGAVSPEHATPSKANAAMGINIFMAVFLYELSPAFAPREAALLAVMTRIRRRPAAGSMSLRNLFAHTRMCSRAISTLALWSLRIAEIGSAAGFQRAGRT